MGSLGAAIFAACFLLAPTPALAHTSERGFILLLPTGYYLLGGALAVVASFVILLAIPVERLKRWSNARLDLGTLHVPRETWFSLASFALLALLVLAGFFGSRDPLANPLPLTIWSVWWVGVTLAHALFGNLWRYLNPWSGSFRLLRLHKAPLPYRLGYWPAVLGLFAFAWFELIYPAPADPAILAWAIIHYSVITWVGMALFGEETWLARAETFSVFFSLVARIAPLQSEPATAGRKRFYLVIPGRALADLPPLPLSGLQFVLLTLATVSFDGLDGTFWWLGLHGINPLEFPGRTAVTGINSFGLLAMWLALSAAFLICIALGRARAGALVVSILPISIGYQFAHYLTSFLVNVQYAAIVITDPFARGWFGADERMRGVTTSFLSNQDGVTVIWNLQAGGIVLGHVIAILVAHLITLKQRTERQEILAAQAPLAALMVAYTMFGLWLLSTPAAG